MSKAAHWKAAVKETLKRLGTALKEGASDRPELLVLRFHSPVDRERGLDMIGQAYGRIPWDKVDLSADRSGSYLHGLLTSKDRPLYLLLWNLPGEPRDIPDEFLASLKLGLVDGAGVGHRVVLCVLSSAVKIMADRIPETWGRKLGYMAWPLQPGVTEAAISLDPDEESSEESSALDAKETRRLLGRLQQTDSAYYLVKVAKQKKTAGETENARLLLLRAVEIFYENSDIEGLARTYHMLGEIAAVRADHHAALEWIQQALENWRVADNPRGLSDTLAFKGILHYQTEQLDYAIKAFKEAMALDEGLGDQARLSAGYRRMAMVFEKNLELKRARELYEKSLVLEQGRNSSEGIARVYHHLGRLAELDEDWDEAEAQYRESLRLKEEIGDKPGMAASWHQLGNLHIKTRAFETAVECYEEALLLEVELNDGEGRARTLAQLGLARMELSDPEGALRDLVLAYNILQKLRSPLAGEVLSKLEELQELLTPETFNNIVRGTARPQFESETEPESE